MHLERRIRKPSSREAALEEYRTWCANNGYSILSHEHCYWQANLFYDELDAVVESSVRRQRVSAISKEVPQP